MNEEIKANGIATARQIRDAAEAQRFEKPEEVTLPESGFKILVRKPRPGAYLLLGGPLPQSIATKLASLGNNGNQLAQMSPEDTHLLSLRFLRVLCASVIKPKFSLEPTDDEVHPDFLSPNDQTFLIRYIGGQIGPDGSDLESFRDGAERGPSVARPDGGDVRPEAAQLPDGSGH
jgi:hypothetical protein